MIHSIPLKSFRVFVGSFKYFLGIWSDPDIATLLWIFLYENFENCRKTDSFTFKIQVIADGTIKVSLVCFFVIFQVA